METGDDHVDEAALKAAKRKAKLEAKRAKKAAAKAKALERKKNAASQAKNAKALGKGKQLRLKKAFENPTPKGEKKDVSGEMPAEYDPPAVEAAWYDWWEKEGYFQASADDDSKPTYTIVVPPPNVTGYLHMGHALTGSVEDVLIRWHRMRGHNTLWVPGCDHAGIATQVVVEKRLLKETGKSRHDIGREAFLEECWKWKGSHGAKIYDQMRRMGSSLDWERESFTMSPALSNAVTEAFVRLHDKGLIYRKTRLVNWDCALNTAVSNIEVDNEQLDKPRKFEVAGHPAGNKYKMGVIYDFSYPVAGSDEKLRISTTRPETMLGDTGVAVHPDDERYKHLHGCFVEHPFNGRKIPIITDAVLVDMEFGTGVVKITPAHDHNDFASGARNGLPTINILNDDGTINEAGAPFTGMPRFEARVAILKALKEKGLYHGERPNSMVLPICSRSKDIIEPRLKPQWWVNTEDMAARAVAAVDEGELEIIPAHPNVSTWHQFLGPENVQPWCISRQLWWGHRIPAYLVCIDGEDRPDDELDENYVVGRTREEAMERARAKFPEVDASRITLEQDPDVLDTWFSSGLFPFSSLGWPDEEHPDYKRFYPTQVLETGHDILFFWVARMVMMGLELTGKLPFTQVYLHPMVRDAHGVKMSKSLGNVIDPIDVIEGIRLEDMHERLKRGNLDERKIKDGIAGQKKDFPNGISECGTDAMRFALCAYLVQGRSINFNINVVISYRHFCNKLWNMVKFARMNWGPEFVPSAAAERPDKGDGGRAPIERWLLSQLRTTTATCNGGMDTFDLSRAALAVHDFLLHKVCDVYVEAVKPTFQSAHDGEADEGHASRKASACNTLYTAIETALRLMHPFMPYVTEELWQRLPKRPGNVPPSIMIAPYPDEADMAAWEDEDAENATAAMLHTVHALRSFRADYGLKPKIRPEGALRIKEDGLLKHHNEYSDVIVTLASLGKLRILSGSEEPPVGPGWVVSIHSDNLEMYLDLTGLVDITAEVGKLEAQKKKTIKSIDQVKNKMSKPTYSKVPEHVREKDSAKLESLGQEVKNIDEAIARFSALEG